MPPSIRVTVLATTSVAALMVMCHTACAAPPPRPAHQREAGWQALWSNEYARADSCFSSALAKDGDDQSSRRGRLLTALAVGRDDVVLDELEEYGKRVPSSEFDFFIPAVVRRFSGMDSRRFHEAIARYSERLAEADDIAVVDRRVFEGLASNHAYLSGDAGEVERLGRRLNRLDRWCVIGPFDNTSGSGHRKDLVDPRRVTEIRYSGKFGQPVKWFSPNRIALDRSISPTQYFHQNENTTAYLRTVAEVDEDGEYLVSVGYAGDMSFSINGHVVGEGSRYSGGEEVLHWFVHLPAGKNLFTFRLSNRDRPSFASCALSNPDGSAPVGLRLEPAAEMGMSRPEDPTPLPVVPSFLERLSARLGENPDDPEVRFWDLQRALQFADPDSTAALCGSLAIRFADCAMVQLAVADAFGSLGDLDGSRHHMNAAAELAPDLAPAVLDRAEEQLEKHRAEPAMSIAEGVLHRAPRCRQALELRLRCMSEQHLLEELRSAAQAVVELLPDDPLGYSFLAAHASERGLSSEEKRFRKKMIDRMPTTTAIILRYIESAEEEDYAEMEDELKRFMKLAPDSAILAEQYVAALLSRGSEDRAYDALLEALRTFPQSIALLYCRALFAEAGYDFDVSTVSMYFTNEKRTLTDEEMRLMWPGESAPTRVISLLDGDAVQRWFKAHCGGAAAGILEDALAIDPGNFELREKVRALRGLPSLRTILPDPDQDAILSMRVSPERFAGEDAVVLTERKRRLAYNAHASVADYCLAVQVLNEEGVRRWEDYAVGANPYASDIVYVSAKTVKEDGTESQAATAFGRVLFKNVEPGDMLYLHYQSTPHVSGALSGNFWDAHLFSFRDPCLESVYTLTTPKEMNVLTALHNASGTADSVFQMTESLDGGYIRRVWRSVLPTQIAREPGAAAVTSYLPWLDVSTIGDWRTLATWYSDLADGQAEVTRSVRSKAAELVADADTEEEKLRRILSFVSDEIAYQSIPFFQSAHIPREADEVLRHKFGDCKDKCTLMAALLTAAGIENCHLALVAVGSDERSTFLPSPRFDHVVIVRLSADGTCDWYDPTVRFPDPGQVPGAIAGARALVVREAENGLRTIPERDPCEHMYSTETTATVAAEGTLEVHRRSTFASIDETSSLRTHLESVSRRTSEDELLQSIAVSHPGAELLFLEIAGAREDEEPLVFDYSFRAPNAFVRTGDILSGTVPEDTHLTDALGAVVAKRERTSPVDLRSLGLCERSRVVIELPEGVDVVAMPEPNDLEFAGCRYSTDYKREGNSLVIEREAVIAGTFVSVEDYPRFKSFLDDVLQDMRVPLLLK